jgi:hypothetical protein
MYFKPLNTELNPICHMLALLGARHILHVNRIRVKSTEALLMYHGYQHFFAFQVAIFRAISLTKVM